MEISEALRLTRNKSGKSQEFMSSEIGVSRRTVQNWESGASEPGIGQVIKWFSLCAKNPVPYFLKYLFPEMDKISTSHEAPDDKDLANALMLLVNELPPEGKRELFFMLCGDHGSSPRAILELVTAHLQTPMKDRVTQAGVVIHNYEMAEKKGNVAKPGEVKPDLEFLKSALAAGEAAVLRDAGEYSVVKP